MISVAWDDDGRPLLAVEDGQASVQECNSCKYSHGCSLPLGHGGDWHACDPDEDGFDPADPHNTACFAWRIDDPEAFKC